MEVLCLCTYPSFFLVPEPYARRFPLAGLPVIGLNSYDFNENINVGARLQHCGGLPPIVIKVVIEIVLLVL